ncbi:hypothetical protein [Terrimonas pollutisoli]|uniref:hypothetical protein n=1 Tax=Terrimonas pollutisoli TaxID=3034147 RepID=UPI0023EB6857|nr:hypothetical protein [Terrimonas sp. H1YJ31]
MRLSEPEFDIVRGVYLKHFSIDIPDEILKEYQFVVMYKEFIKSATPQKRILNALLDITLDKIRLNKRFQKITMIRLIRSQSHPEVVDKIIAEKLFELFRSLLWTVNDEIAWKLSVSLRDIMLTKEQLFWLIDNYKRSVHIQNRLLRYPQKNTIISEWAKQVYSNHELKDREVELAGLILNIDQGFRLQDSAAFLWAIHYSKLPVKTKKQLLWKNLSHDNFLEFLKICDRNGYTDLIKRLYETNSRLIFSD